jgi:hypothetical protein
MVCSAALLDRIKTLDGRAHITTSTTSTTSSLLIVLIGWTGSQHRYLDKYSQMLQTLSSSSSTTTTTPAIAGTIDCIQFVPNKWAVMNQRKLISYARSLLPLLADAIDELQPCNVLFHMYVYHRCKQITDAYNMGSACLCMCCHQLLQWWPVALHPIAASS